MLQVAENLLSCAEVARRVSGVGCKPTNASTVFRWCKSGRLRAVRVGRKLLVPESALSEFLATETAAWRERILVVHNDLKRPRESRECEVAEALARLGRSPSKK